MESGDIESEAQPENLKRGNREFEINGFNLREANSRKEDENTGPSQTVEDEVATERNKM